MTGVELRRVSAEVLLSKISVRDCIFPIIDDMCYTQRGSDPGQIQEWHREDVLSWRRRKYNG